MKIKKKRGARKNGKPWPNNIGPWLEKLPADKRAELFQRAARTVGTGEAGAEEGR